MSERVPEGGDRTVGRRGGRVRGGWGWDQLHPRPSLWQPACTLLTGAEALIELSLYYQAAEAALLPISARLADTFSLNTCLTSTSSSIYLSPLSCGQLLAAFLTPLHLFPQTGMARKTLGVIIFYAAFVYLYSTIHLNLDGFVNFITAVHFSIDYHLKRAHLKKTLIPLTDPALLGLYQKPFWGNKDDKARWCSKLYWIVSSEQAGQCNIQQLGCELTYI